MKYACRIVQFSRKNLKIFVFIYARDAQIYLVKRDGARIIHIRWCFFLLLSLDATTIVITITHTSKYTTHAKLLSATCCTHCHRECVIICCWWFCSVVDAATFARDFTNIFFFFRFSKNAKKISANSSKKSETYVQWQLEWSALEWKKYTNQIKVALWRIEEKNVWAYRSGSRKKEKNHCEKCEENAEHIRATEMDSVHSNEQTQWMTVRSIF